MRKKILFIVISAAKIVSPAFSQQTITGNYLLLNPYLVNPAISGLQKDSIPLTLHYRNQWTGFKGAPKTFFLSAQTQWMEYSGAGFYIARDKIGPFSQTEAQLSYSYHAAVHREVMLSLALAGQLQQYSVDYNYLNTDKNDAMIPTGKLSATSYNATFGTHLYHRYFYAGMAIPQMLQSKMHLTDNNAGKEVAHFYSYIGGNIELSRVWKLSPALMHKATKASPMQVDVMTRISYDNHYWGSIVFRTGEAIGIALGLSYQQYQIGYSYDYVYNALRKGTTGSHEITMSINLYAKKKKETNTPQTLPTNITPSSSNP